MKKLIAVMLAGVMTAAMVTGCGGGAADTPADAPAETEAPAEEAESGADAAGDEADAAGAEDTASGESDLAYVQGKGTLVVGITDFEPMDYKDESGNWIGFDADMATAFADSLGVDVEFVEIDWDNKIMELDGKTIDCVWNGMTLTPEVTSAMDCSEPYCGNAQVVVVPSADTDKYPDADSLSDLTFAVEAGSAGEGVVESEELECTPVKTQADALMEVAAGTSGAAVIDSSMADAMVGEGTSYENLAVACTLNSEEYGVGFRKGSDLVKAVNDFFAESLENGTTMKYAEAYDMQDLILEK